MIIVYAIKSTGQNYIYVGQTDNLFRRFNQHNKGKERTTRSYRPFKLIYQEEFSDRTSARIKEKYLKTGVGKNFLRSLISKK